MQQARRIVERFFAAISAGSIPDDLLTDDMSAWATMQGDLGKAQYCGMVQMLAQVTATPIEFTVDAITAQDDRIVVEAQSTAELINGETYSNSYVFILRVNGSRISHVAEHFNALVVQKTLIPAMKPLHE